MKSSILLQLGVGIFLSVTPFHCGGGKDQYPPVNTIEVLDDFNISVSPEKLEYSIGDTIWLTAQIDETKMLFTTGLEGLTNGDGQFQFRVIKLKKAFEYLDEGAPAFDLLQSNGLIQPYSPTKYGTGSYARIIRETYFDYQNKTYSINFGLIPKEVGDYTFYIGSTMVQYGKLPDATSYFQFVNQNFLVNYNNEQLFLDLGYTDKIYVGNSTESYSLPLNDTSQFFAFSVK